MALLIQSSEPSSKKNLDVTLQQLQRAEDRMHIYLLKKIRHMYTIFCVLYKGRREKISE
jgi:hypothetical protein